MTAWHCAAHKSAQLWREDAGSPQASSALTRRLPPKCRDPDRMSGLGHPKSHSSPTAFLPNGTVDYDDCNFDYRQFEGMRLWHKCQR